MPAPVRSEIAVLPQPQPPQPSRKSDEPAQETPFQDVLQEARKGGKREEADSRAPDEKPANAKKNDGSPPARKAGKGKSSSKRAAETEVVVGPAEETIAVSDPAPVDDQPIVATALPEESVELPFDPQANVDEQTDEGESSAVLATPALAVGQVVVEAEEPAEEQLPVVARAQDLRLATTAQPAAPPTPQPAEQAGETPDQPVPAAPQAIAAELPAGESTDEPVEAAPVPVKPQQPEPSAVAAKSRSQQPVAAGQTSQQENAQTSDQSLQQQQQPPAEPEQLVEGAPHAFDAPADDATAAHARAAGTAQAPSPSDAVSVVPVKAHVQSPQLSSEPAAPASPPPTPRELEFAQNNHERLVTAIRTQLLPKGGSMQLRLDPPNLGTLEVAVRMIDGVMSVSFQTSRDETTKLLSHSLTHLKHVLESQGVSVDKLHVQQAPRNSESSDRQQTDQQHHRDNLQDEASARQEQQRKEMLRRMWRKLAMGDDPLDLVA